jgi:hypothetical protein
MARQSNKTFVGLHTKPLRCDRDLQAASPAVLLGPAILPRGDPGERPRCEGRPSHPSFPQCASVKPAPGAASRHVGLAHINPSIGGAETCWATGSRTNAADGASLVCELREAGRLVLGFPWGAQTRSRCKFARPRTVASSTPHPSLNAEAQRDPTINLSVFRRHPPDTAMISVVPWNLPPSREIEFLHPAACV